MTSARLLILQLLLLLTHLTSKAQEYLGFEVGINKEGWVNQNIYQNKPGYAFGLKYSHSLSRTITFSAIPQVLQKKQMQKFGEIVIAHSNRYAQLPILLTWKLGKKNKLNFDMGLFTSYWLISSRKYTIPDILDVEYTSDAGIPKWQLNLKEYKEDYIFDSKKDHRMDFGWIFGLGYEITLSQNNALQISSRYYHSKENGASQTQTSPSGFQNLLAVTIGYLFSLSKL